MKTIVEVKLTNDELHELGFISRDQMASAINAALDQLTNPEGRKVDLGHRARVLLDYS